MVNKIEVYLVFKKQIYKLNSLAFHSVVKGIISKWISAETIDSTALKCVKDAENDVHLIGAARWVGRQNVHQVLAFLILLLYDGIIRCLLYQRKE